MLSYNLKAIFKARQIERPYSFLVKAGISPNSATRILNGDTKIIRLDHIEKICELLCCDPNDLFVYQPKANYPLRDNHPLLKLKPKEQELAWLEELKNMPLSSLKDIQTWMTKEK